MHIKNSSFRAVRHHQPAKLQRWGARLQGPVSKPQICVLTCPGKVARQGTKGRRTLRTTHHHLLLLLLLQQHASSSTLQNALLLFFLLPWTGSVALVSGRGIRIWVFVVGVGASGMDPPPPGDSFICLIVFCWIVSFPHGSLRLWH